MNDIVQIHKKAIEQETEKRRLLDDRSKRLTQENQEEFEKDHPVVADMLKNLQPRSLDEIHQNTISAEEIAEKMTRYSGLDTK